MLDLLYLKDETGNRVYCLKDKDCDNIKNILEGDWNKFGSCLYPQLIPTGVSIMRLFFEHDVN